MRFCMDKAAQPLPTNGFRPVLYTVSLNPAVKPRR